MKRSKLLKGVIGGAFAGLLLLGGIGSGANAGPSGNDPQTGKPAAGANASNCVYPVSVANGSGGIKTSGTEDPSYYSSTSWVPLDCAMVRVTIPKGKTAGIVATVDAELTYTPDSGTDTSSWFEGRILFGGGEGWPKTPDATGSFAWVASSTDSADWQNHSFTRSITITCGTTADCVVPVQVQVKAQSSGHTARVDDTSLSVQYALAA